MVRLWYSTGELAELWGYSDRFVRSLIARGLLRAIAFDAGGRPTYRIHRDEVDRFTKKYFRQTTGGDSSLGEQV